VKVDTKISTEKQKPNTITNPKVQIQQEGRAEGNPSLTINTQQKYIEGRAEGHPSLKQPRRTTPAGSSKENRRHHISPRKKRRQLVSAYCLFLYPFLVE